jgi:predicted dehydrogenase
MRIRPAVVADIAAATYEEGGATEAELETIQSYGLLDRNRLLLPGTAPAVIKKQIGVCVVGTGWGSFHCRLVRQASPSARLFVCGQNAQRTAKLAKVVGADDFFIDINAASQDPRIQAFTLAIPHDLHRPIVEVVIGAGKSALVEKPIATTLQDADAMIGASKKSGALLIVAEDLHFRPAIREATRRIALGDVGEPLYLLVHGGGIRRPRGWAAIRERMGGGVLLDIGVHYVRALRLLMGEPHKVFAWRAMQIDTKIEGEDSVQLMFSSDVGWGAHMLLSWSSQRGNLPDMVLAGETGTFHFWPGASYYDYYPVTPRGLTRGFSYLRPHWLRDKLMTPRLQRIRLAVPDNDPTGYVNEFKEFLSAVAEDRKSITPPEDARRDLEIVLSAYDALGSGQSTSIKSPC